MAKDGNGFNIKPTPVVVTRDGYNMLPIPTIHGYRKTTGKYISIMYMCVCVSIVGTTYVSLSARIQHFHTCKKKLIVENQTRNLIPYRVFTRGHAGKMCLMPWRTSSRPLHTFDGEFVAVAGGYLRTSGASL